MSSSHTSGGVGGNVTQSEFDDHNARHEPGGADPLAVDAAAATGSLRTLGAGAAQAAQGSHGHAHGDLSAVTANQHHNQAHTESDHSDLTYVRKPANEIVNNSNTAQADDALVLALGANEFWAFKLTLWYSSVTSTPNFRHVFTVPAGATGRRRTVAVDAGVAGVVTNYTADLTSVIDIDLGTVASIVIEGHVSTGGEAGNLTFQWAQAVATAEDTRVLTNSHLEAHRLA